MPILTLQTNLDGTWHDAMEVTVSEPSPGYRGESRFAYSFPYSNDFADSVLAAVSCRYPVNFEIHQLPQWPAFLLDILPSGAGRVHWLKMLDLPDGPAADWALLLHGAGNPPGHLRVAGTPDRRNALVPRADGELVVNREHPGFTRDDILERQEFFIEYATQNGAHAAGGTDVQGVAPKFLLQQDRNDRWHAEGVLADDQVAACWIVKFPRGRTAEDRLILRNEAAYMRAAALVGIHTHPAPTEWEANSLFIPRFDRVVGESGLERFGLESLCSLAGVADFGVSVSQDHLARALVAHTTNPRAALTEFVRRDILNLALGNTDNHARNTAVLRLPDGSVALSPLFDMAPMWKDPQMIARVCRWSAPAEVGGRPTWGLVAELCGGLLPDLDAIEFRDELAGWAATIERLPDILRQTGTDDSIIEERVLAIEAQCEALRDARPRRFFTAPQRDDS